MAATNVTDVTLNILGLLPEVAGQERLEVILIAADAVPNGYLSFTLTNGIGDDFAMRINEDPLDPDNGATISGHTITLQASFFQGGELGYLPVFFKPFGPEFPVDYMGTPLEGISGAITVYGPTSSDDPFDPSLTTNFTPLVFKDLTVAVNGTLPAGPGASSTLQLVMTVTTFSGSPAPDISNFKLLLRPEYGRFSTPAGVTAITNQYNGVAVVGSAWAGSGPYTLTTTVTYTLPVSTAVDVVQVRNDFTGVLFASIGLWFNQFPLPYNTHGPAGTETALLQSTVTVDLSGLMFPGTQLAESIVLAALQNSPNGEIDYDAVSRNVALSVPAGGQAVSQVAHSRQILLGRGVEFGSVFDEAVLVADGSQVSTGSDPPIVTM